MEDQDYVHDWDDGELPERKRKPQYHRNSSIPIIVAVIGAAATIMAALITVVPVGSEEKPLVCYITDSSWAVCNGSIVINDAGLRQTQLALEQRETQFAQTQTAAAPGGTLLITPTVDWNTIKEVHSERLWQDTGIEVEKGQRLLIEVIDGRWRKSPTESYNDGIGTGYICGNALTASDCVEPMPLFPTDALIGRVDNQLVFVGQRILFVADQSGRLSLHMNDGDNGVWDNDGSLMVGIAILNE